MTSPAPATSDRWVGLVRWPVDEALRETLAAAGASCLLVVDAGAEIPALRPSEDWVWSSTDERDVAVRLDQLARSTRRPSPLPPVGWPATLTDDERRVARSLTSALGRFVPVSDLDADDLPARVRSLRVSFDRSGFTLTEVGTSGYLLEGAAASRP